MGSWKLTLILHTCTCTGAFNLESRGLERNPTKMGSWKPVSRRKGHSKVKDFPEVNLKS